MRTAYDALQRAIVKDFGRWYAFEWDSVVDEAKERIKQGLAYKHFSNPFLTNLSDLYIDSVLSNFFTLETTKEALANSMTALETTITGSYLLMSGVFSEISGFIAKTIDENFLSLDEFFARVSGLLTSVTGTIKTIITDCFSSVHKTFEKYIRPAFEQFQEGFSKAFGKVVEVWNTAIMPLLQIIADGFRDLWDNHLSPFVDEVFSMVGAFIECVATIYNKVIAPIVGYLFEEFWPKISIVLSGVWGLVEGVVKYVVGLARGLVEILRGVFETISGILQGDTEKITEGVKTIFTGFKRVVVTTFTGVVNILIDAMNGFIKGLNNIKIPGTDIGVNIPEFKRYEPKLADGGIVYRQTDFGGFVAGEAGAEAIVPLENSEYTKVLAREIVNGMVEAGIGGGDTYNIENAFGDDRAMERLVNKIADTQKRMGARKGVIAYG